MDFPKESGPTLARNTLSGVSFDKILKYAFNHSEDLRPSEFEESENISSFLSFLRNIWTYLTDSSLYASARAGSVPFLEDDRTRELVANNVLKFLDSHREELSPMSRDSESPTSALSNIAQGHLVTVFKLLSSFLTALSPENALVFSEFVVDESEYFSRSFGDLALRSSNKRMAQTCEAKLIGLVKLLESSLEQQPEADCDSTVFRLRLLLNQCLPLSHLGICNRQSAVAEPRRVAKMPQEEWSRLERATLRAKCEGLSDYEIASYESVASPASAKFPSSQIYDIKSYLARSDKSEGALVRSVSLPSYEVYSSFCDLYEFVQNPEIVSQPPYWPQVLSKTHEYVEALQRNYACVLAHVNGLVESHSGVDAGRGIGSFEFAGGVAEFVNKSSSLRFWSGFLVSSALSLQNLRLFHKKDEQTAFELLKDKCVAVLEGVERDIWATMARVRDLSYLARAMLQNERDWINWKMNGCKFDLEKLNEDKITPVRWEDRFDREGGDEPGEAHERILDTLRELEKISKQFGDKDSTIGVNCVPVLSSMELNKESIYWYIDDPDRDLTKMSCDEQLACKFDDYCRKLEMDEDPENDIAEPEKSKYNPLFKFRFARLFGLNHLEKFMEMSNDDIAAGGIEAMLRVARAAREEPEESAPKRQKS